MNKEADARGAGLAERGGGGFGDLDGTVEEVFAGGEDFDLRAEEAFAERTPREVVRGVGVEAEVAVEQIGVGVVVELAAAEAAFEAEGSEARAGGAEIERGHVARDFGNPVAQILRAARDDGVRVLVAAVDDASQERG